jgi:threonine aldolase
MTNQIKSFASDNYAPAHPEVIEALIQANTGDAPAYGADEWSDRARALISQTLRRDVESFFVFNGTGANITGLASLLHPGSAVICASQSHLNNDEGGAPERILGIKLIDLPTKDAKLTPDDVVNVWRRVGDEHTSQPRVVSVTQSTELGTVYQVSELVALAECVHGLGGLLHIDGARISNAAVHLGAELADITTKTGADLLSFGGTKNGLVGAEAVVFLQPMENRFYPWIRKSLMQLSSKQRFISAQFIALLSNDLWRRNASHANSMASKLAKGLSELTQVEVAYPVQANAVFLRMQPRLIAELLKTYRFYVWDERENLVRLMCSWNTEPELVDEFIKAIAESPTTAPTQ